MEDSKEENTAKDSTRNAQEMLVNLDLKKLVGLDQFSQRNQWANASGRVLERTKDTFQLVALGSLDVLEKLNAVERKLHQETESVKQSARKLFMLERKPNAHGENTQRNSVDSDVVHKSQRELKTSNQLALVFGKEKLFYSRKFITKLERFALNINAVNNFQNVLLPMDATL
jgi:hypothetical protein